jgi:hypothetical protein
MITTTKLLYYKSVNYMNLLQADTKCLHIEYYKTEAGFTLQNNWKGFNRPKFELYD